MAESPSSRTDPLSGTPSTREIEEWLKTGEQEARLRQLFGKKLYDDLREATSEGAVRRLRSKKSPVVIIIPGILGSNIGYAKDAIWLDLRDIRNGRLKELSLDTSNGTRDIDVLWMYVSLRVLLGWELLGGDFRFEYFSYDWRRSLVQSGKALAQHVKAQVAAGAPEVFIVAHSMGGLVARQMLASKFPELAKVQRVIQLGTPNRGSFAPVDVYLETNESLQKAAWLDKKHDARELITDVFASFQG